MHSEATTHVVSVSASVPASAERAYQVFADYHNGHPHILPEQFSNMVVEKGGIGAGTIVRFDMRAFGRTQTCRAEISEPHPGRVLVETDLGPKGVVTTFVVDPVPAPGQSRVTISTAIPVKSGIGGRLERFLITRLLHPIYERELVLLSEFLKGRTSASAA